jgi:Leucine-rich repeat (LRR) protein
MAQNEWGDVAVAAAPAPAVNEWGDAPVAAPAAKQDSALPPTGLQKFTDQVTSPAIPGTPLAGRLLHGVANFANTVYNMPIDIATSIAPGAVETAGKFLSQPFSDEGKQVQTQFEQSKQDQPFPLQQQHPYINQAVQDAVSVLPLGGEATGVLRGIGTTIGDIGKASYGQDLNITKSLGTKAGNGIPFAGKEQILNTIQDNNLGSFTLSKSFDKTNDLIGQKSDQYHEILNNLPPDPQTGTPGAYRTVVPSQIATLSDDDFTKLFPAGEREQAKAAMDKITGEIKNYDKPTLLADFDNIKDDLAPVYNKGTLLSTPDAVANTVRKALTYKVLDYFEQNVDPSLRQLGRDMKDLYDVKEAYANVLSSGMNKKSLLSMPVTTALELLIGGGVGALTHGGVGGAVGAGIGLGAAAAGGGGRLGAALMGGGKTLESLSQLPGKAIGSLGNTIGSLLEPGAETSDIPAWMTFKADPSTMGPSMGDIGSTRFFSDGPGFNSPYSPGESQGRLHLKMPPPEQDQGNWFSNMFKNDRPGSIGGSGPTGETPGAKWAGTEAQKQDIFSSMAPDKRRDLYYELKKTEPELADKLRNNHPIYGKIEQKITAPKGQQAFFWMDDNGASHISAAKDYDELYNAITKGWSQADKDNYGPTIYDADGSEAKSYIDKYTQVDPDVKIASMKQDKPKGGYDNTFFYTDVENKVTMPEILNAALAKNELIPDGITVAGDLRFDLEDVFRHLPKNMTVNGDLGVAHYTRLEPGLTVQGNFFAKTLYELPKDMTVRGNLNVSRSHLHELPENLKVYRGLDISNTQISELPKSLKMLESSDLKCSNTPIKKLPDGLGRFGTLDINNTQIKELPKNLEVSMKLDVSHTLIEELPPDFKAPYQELNISNTRIKQLPENIESVQVLKCSNTPIKKLPDGLDDVWSLDISNTPIKELPKDLKVSGYLNIGGKTDITDFPSGVETILVNNEYLKNVDPILLIGSDLKKFTYDLSEAGHKAFMHDFEKALKGPAGVSGTQMLTGMAGTSIAGLAAPKILKSIANLKSDNNRSK